MICLALAACVLITSMPSRAFSLNVCDCGTVIYESLSSQDDGCPCLRDLGDASAQDTCGKCPTECPDPAGPLKPQDSGDSCCTHVLALDLHSTEHGGKAIDLDVVDGELQPIDLDSRPADFDLLGNAVCATGPPSGDFRMLRLLLERRATVLLI